MIYLLGNYKIFIYIISNLPIKQSCLNSSRDNAARLSKILNQKN